MTADALERLNDAAFELLAVRSLRELATECHAVIHMGMNAQDKDGFRPSKAVRDFVSA